MKSTSSEGHSHSSVHNGSSIDMNQAASSSPSIHNEVDQDLLLAQQMQQLENEGRAYEDDEYAIPDDCLLYSESHNPSEQEERDQQHALMLQYQEMNYTKNQPTQRPRSNKKNQCVIH